MANKYLFFAAKMVLVMLVQILVLNGLNLHGTVQPYIFPILILMLPVEVSHWLLILFGFFVGLLIDFDLNTGAIYAACAVLMSFCRPFVLAMFRQSAKMGEKEMMISIRSQSFGFFWRYSLVSLAIFHLFLFLLEPYSFSEILYSLLKLILSLLVSFILVLLTDVLLNPSSSKQR